MECWCVSKHKSPSWLLILMMMMIGSLMVWQTQGVCIEEERKALLQIKTSFVDSYHVDPPLRTWVDHGGECCDWERVTCNTITGHVKNLSLTNIMGMPVVDDPSIVDCKRMWPLNVSVFLHFKELTSLDLSRNCLDNNIVTTGFERLSSLKHLDLSNNRIENDIFPSLGALTTLRDLNLGYNKLEGYFPALALENLEILDLSENYGMQGFERISLFKKLKVLNLGNNEFDKSIITSLSALPLLKALDLSSNSLISGSFPAQELIDLTNLERLDLSFNYLNDTPSIQECTRLSRLKRLKSITLKDNILNKSIISCLSALPSLKILDLSSNFFGGSIPIQELAHMTNLEELDLTYNNFKDTPSIQEMSHLPDLKVLILSYNDFNGTLPMEALASFHHLEVLDLSGNNFVGSIPSTIRALSSLRVISFAYNHLNGSLHDHGLCELKKLHELDLSGNKFEGNLSQCFNRLSSLKLLDISSNQFTGTLPPSLIANLTSLEYVDFSNNGFEGSFSFSFFSDHTKLEAVRFGSINNKFEVETEEPIGWIPMFQLKVLLLSSCNINRRKGNVVPGFLFHQYKLQELDLSRNSLVGQFPNWLIENNTMLETLNLRNNSVSGIIHMPRYRNAKTRWLDVSENHMNGAIPGDIHKLLPNLLYLNLSSNSLEGVIPSSIGDLSNLRRLDLSGNELSGEVSNGFLTNLSSLRTVKLSRNRLHGQVLSGNLSLGYIETLGLDNNYFTGEIGNVTFYRYFMQSFDISNNFFTGMIPDWISNMMTDDFELIVRNNSLEGRFPCGTTSFSFLDISQNSFSGPIPSCLNFQDMKHLHLGSNRFTGPIPNFFRNLTSVLTLDIGNNSLSGIIPGFLGNLSNLRILILRKNKFSGFIPTQLCQLSNVSLIDLSSNSLSGSIPSCLQNITTPVYLAFEPNGQYTPYMLPSYTYPSVQDRYRYPTSYWMRTPDEIQFTTKALSLAYKGSILDYLVGLDLSDNKLTGEIPKELGLLTEIYSLNLSHNQLVGPIPTQFSNLRKIESLDLSSNGLSGNVPSQLIQLTSLAVFSVSNNNLSGRLPEMKAQFGTFTKESYEGNPLLCGPPLEKKCTTTSQVINPSAKEGTKEGSEKWYDIDMASFYGSSGATWVVFLLGFGAVLYINPYWRKRWLDMVEECMYTSYYFLCDCFRKLRF